MHDQPMPTILTLEREDAVVALWTVPETGSFRFDFAEYDEASDRLRLTSGPPAAAWTERTPEGHMMRVSVPDGRINELVLVEVRRRLMRDGRIEVTLGPGQHASLGVEDVAHLLTRRASERTGRFARSA